MSTRSRHRGSGRHSGAFFEPLESRLLLSGQPLPVLDVVAMDATAAETFDGQAPDDGTVSIYRTTPAGDAVTDGDLTVNFKLSGTAKGSKDYALSVDGVPVAGDSVVIPDGFDHLDLQFLPTDDSVVEPTETAVLALAKDADYTLTPIMADRMAAVSIADDTPTVTLAVTDAVASQPGDDPATFQLTRTGYTGNSLSVQIKLSGTAKNGVDYSTLPTSVTFAPGSATADVVITPIPADVPELTKTALLSLKRGAGYTVGTLKPASASVEYHLLLSDYFPTTMGTWWHYTSTVGGRDIDAYQRVKENATINGLLTTEMISTVNAETITTDYFIINANSLSYVQRSFGVEHGTETQTYNTPLATIPSTFTLGSAFSAQGSYAFTRTIGGNSTGTITQTMAVSGKVQKVKVPFDTYNAGEITLTDTWTDADGWHGTTTKNYWVAKGIGVIKATVRSASADKKNGHKFSLSYTASLASWST